MAASDYLPKLKGCLGLGFEALLHDFPMKMFFYFNTLSMGIVSMSHLLSFPRYQTKCVIKFLFRQLMMSQTIRSMLDQPLKQWLTRRKRREDENTKI